MSLLQWHGFVQGHVLFLACIYLRQNISWMFNNINEFHFDIDELINQIIHAMSVDSVLNL